MSKKINFRYEPIVKVYIGSEYVGRIRKDKEGWRYYPKCHVYGSSYFETLEDCMASLI